MKANKFFLNTLKLLKEFGIRKTSRPKYKDGKQTESISIHQISQFYNIEAGETVIHNYRPTAIKTAINEILWIYKDQTNCLKKAREYGINWWEDWNIGDDTIGFAYGKTVKDFNLMNILLHEMETEPFSRRHILSLWQQEHIEKQKQIKNGLVPCAFMTIWSIDPEYNIDLTLIQRSGDYITASSSINPIQYVAFGLMVAGHLSFETGIKHKLRYFMPFTQDLHIYDRHEAALEELLTIEPSFESQTIELLEDKNFYDYTIDDFKINKIKIQKLKSELELAI